jgi:hypothetical protein
MPSPVIEVTLAEEDSPDTGPEGTGRRVAIQTANPDSVLPPRLQDRLAGLFARSDGGDYNGLAGRTRGLIAAEN